MVTTSTKLAEISPYGPTRATVEGTPSWKGLSATACTRQWQRLSTGALKISKRFSGSPRSSGVARFPRWPMIILRSPKDWTAPDSQSNRPLQYCNRSRTQTQSGACSHQGQVQERADSLLQLRVRKRTSPQGLDEPSVRTGNCPLDTVREIT